VAKGQAEGTCLDEEAVSESHICCVGVAVVDCGISVGISKRMFTLKEKSMSCDDEEEKEAPASIKGKLKKGTNGDKEWRHRAGRDKVSHG
jgi:hypothetical protein